MTRSHRIQVGPIGSDDPGRPQCWIRPGQEREWGSAASKTGLIDTGATCTAISTAVFQSLQPIQSGTTPLNRPEATQRIVHTYAVRLKFEGHLAPNPWFDLDVVVANPGTSGIDVLVGMDVLSQLVLFYEGVNGNMVLTYC